MLPKFLLDGDDDWQEGFRRRVFPRLHRTLVRIGSAVGVPLYAAGTLWYVGHAATLDEDEEVIEEELVELGFRRNPVACFKSLKDGRQSEGSWALIHEDDPERIEPGRQLHVTMFERRDGKPGRELHAHYEDDWRVAPLSHLRAKEFSYDQGVSVLVELLDEQTFLVNRKQK